jgi:hypothetical protein
MQFVEGGKPLHAACTLWSDVGGKKHKIEQVTNRLQRWPQKAENPVCGSASRTVACLSVELDILTGRPT